MRNKLFLTIAALAALGGGLIVPLAAEAKSGTVVHRRAATPTSTITSFSSSSAPTSAAPTSSLSVGVNHPAKK